MTTNVLSGGSPRCCLQGQVQVFSSLQRRSVINEVPDGYDGKYEHWQLTSQAEGLTKMMLHFETGKKKFQHFDFDDQRRDWCGVWIFGLWMVEQLQEQGTVHFLGTPHTLSTNSLNCSYQTNIHFRSDNFLS